VSSRNLDTNIFKGEATVEKVDIKSTALSRHGIPVSVVYGRLDKLAVKFPWSGLSKEATTATADGIFMLGSVDSDILLKHEVEASLAAFSELDNLCAEKKTSKSSFVMNAIQPVVANLRVVITNVHVRVELQHESDVVAAGVVIRRVALESVDSSGAPIFHPTPPATVCKRVTLSGVSVYFDSHERPVAADRSAFTDAMRDLMRSPHSYVLHDFCLTATVTLPLAAASGGVRASLSSPPLAVVFGESQWSVFAMIAKSVNRFNVQRRFLFCGRPAMRTADDSLAWWQYGWRAARAKRFPLMFRPLLALQFLRPGVRRHVRDFQDSKTTRGALEQRWGRTCASFSSATP
jgi:hypothetical protein